MMALNPMNYVNLFLNGVGPFSDCATGMTALVRTASDSESPPDVQIVSLAGNFNADFGVRFPHLMGISQETYDAVYKPHAEK
jgi:hypothetical protein